LLGELDRLRDPASGGMTPRTCWIIPAEGSKFLKGSKPPVLSGIVGFFVFSGIITKGLAALPRPLWLVGFKGRNYDPT
jgi:hypothetical protein